MDISVDGAVIREVTIHDSDKMLTVLTGKFGKISVYAKGVKNLNNKNSVGTQIFSYSDFDLLERSGRYVLKTAVLKEGFFDVRKEMSRFSLACYIAETVGAVTYENDDATEILRLFLNTLYAIAKKTELTHAQIKAAYELKLMALSGFSPELGFCSECGNEIDEKNIQGFCLSDACVICRDCAKRLKNEKGQNIPYSSRISGNVLEAMRYITSSPQSKFLSFTLDDAFLPELSFICENYLINMTERNYETLKIYKSMAKPI